MQKTQTQSSALAHQIANVKNLQLQKRIGSTLYRVGVYFNEESPETFAEKALRLAKNDLNEPQNRAKMQLPQIGRLLERGSL